MASNSGTYNPLGRCYISPSWRDISFWIMLTRSQSVEALKEIAGFCGQHDLHLILEEVFAMSVHDNPQVPNAVPSTSALVLNLDNKIFPQNVHVASGMSKDSGVPGFGWVYCTLGTRVWKRQYLPSGKLDVDVVLGPLADSLSL